MCHDGNGHSVLQDTSGLRESNFELAVDHAELPVFTAAPDWDSRGQVIIVSDIWGANVFYHDLARRLARAGFTAYLPNLFIRVGELSEQTHEAARARGARLSFPQALLDIRRLVSHVQERGKIGVVGFCMGGTLVMHLAAVERALSCGVIYYGFPANRNRTANRPIEPMGETALVNMPLLGFWGDQDQGVGMDNVAQYDRLLSTAHKAHEFHIYPGLGHGFLTFDESAAAYQGSRESWQRSEEFFGEHLA